MHVVRYETHYFCNVFLFIIRFILMQNTGSTSLDLLNDPINKYQNTSFNRSMYLTICKINENRNYFKNKYILRIGIFSIIFSFYVSQREIINGR